MRRWRQRLRSSLERGLHLAGLAAQRSFMYWYQIIVGCVSMDLKLTGITSCQGVLRSASGGNLACPEHLCWSSTDDSGYEAGYETDADESELSEWESGNVRQGHKRKLEALVNLTMQMSFSAEIPSGQKNEEKS
eukprot:g30094.t1